MYASQPATGRAVRSGFRPFTCLPTQRRVESYSFKNKENLNFAPVDQYRRHAFDSGSSEVQIVQLSARVAQIAKHLANNKKDFSARRGLELILSQRKSLLQYLYRKDRDSYDRLLSELKLRSVVVGDTRGASRNKDDKDKL